GRWRRSRAHSPHDEEPAEQASPHDETTRIYLGEILFRLYLRDPGPTALRTLPCVLRVQLPAWSCPSGTTTLRVLPSWSASSSKGVLRKGPADLHRIFRRLFSPS